MRPHQPGFPDFISGMWAALHRTARLTIQEDEIHCLRMLALASDDDLVSNLLLRKLRMAEVTDFASAPAGLVVMNSFLEYSIDGGMRTFCQLRHPSIHAPNYGQSVVSLVGAGLIGLRAGQTILWPNESGALCDLHVVHVENCPEVGTWVGSKVEERRASA